AGDSLIKPSVWSPPDRDLRLNVQVEFGRTALQCHAIADIERSTRGSLGIGTFLSNVVHSFPRTGLRTPSTPRLAAARFCPPRSSATSHGVAVAAAQPIQPRVALFPGSGV